MKSAFSSSRTQFLFPSSSPCVWRWLESIGDLRKRNNVQRSNEMKKERERKGTSETKTGHSARVYCSKDSFHSKIRSLDLLCASFLLMLLLAGVCSPLTRRHKTVET